jgi:DNA adenine methylase
MKLKDENNVIPLLKWVGGKRELLPELRKFYENLEFNNYYEPFFGGGSVYLDIIKIFGNEKKENSFINDINTDLVNLLIHVKENSEEIIKNLYKLKEDYEKNDFYYIRDRFNGIDREKNKVERYEGIQRSSSLLILNRTCFNGLYRTNRSGLFNVPSGKYKNPRLVNEENIKLFSSILPPSQNILNLDFSQIKDIKKNDLVYFDPPYQPINKTSSFTEYSGSFGEEKQRELFNFFSELDKKGVFVILSNSSTDFIFDLYKDFDPFRVYCSRNINSKGDGRGKIEEVVVIGNTLRKKLKL